MSTSPSTPTLPGTDLEPVRSLVRPFQAAAFWLAIALPFAYLPALAVGFETAPVRIFAALLVANAVALVVGHGYNREE
ncbi:MAG: hypothetical protein ABEI11_00195 [Haloarculaceae archaeon]